MDHLSPDHPDHPSNQLHDAAYPTSDYQPANVPQQLQQQQQQHHAQASSSSASPNGFVGTRTAGIAENGAAAGGGKFAEIAAPSLATTSARAGNRSWHDDAGASHDVSHLDTSLGPPPSYEQSQSQSRPTTSSHAASPASPNAAAPSSNNSPNVPVPPIQPPVQAYHAPVSAASFSRDAAVSPAGGATPQLPALQTYGNASGSTIGSLGLASPYQKGVSHMVQLKRRRRRRWCLCAALVVVFVIALGIGVYIGVKGVGDDDDEKGFDDYKKFAGSNNRDGPPWVNANNGDADNVDPDGDGDGDEQRLVVFDWVG